MLIIDKKITIKAININNCINLIIIIKILNNLVKEIIKTIDLQIQ